MKKSLLIPIVLGLSLILVQTSSSKATPKKKPPLSEKSDTDKPSGQPTSDPNNESESSTESSPPPNDSPKEKNSEEQNVSQKENADSTGTEDDEEDSNNSEGQESSSNLDHETDSKAKEDEEGEEEKDDDNEEEDEEDDEDDEDLSDGYDKNPAMTCALFGASGCQAECRLRALLYGTVGQGNCTENQTCQCSSKLVSFYQHWFQRFCATYVYRQILGKDNQLYEKVMEMFRNPLRTGEQYKQLLEPLLSPYEFSKIKVIDNTFAAQFTGKDEPDRKAIRKYINEKFNKVLKPSTTKPLLGADYKEHFGLLLKNIDDHKGTLYNIAVSLERLRNDTLNDIFEEYLKEHDLEKPQINMQRKLSLDEVFNDEFVNFAIERIDKLSKISTKTSQTKKHTKEKRSGVTKKST